MTEAEDFHIGWIKTPGPDWRTDPGEPLAIPNEMEIEGVRCRWDAESEQWCPVLLPDEEA